MTGQSALAQPIRVTDDSGREVSLTKPAQRIITLAPSLTELVFSLGAGDQVVGVMDYSDYPEQALQLPVVGRYDTLDMERIVALQPDLIVAWRSGNPRGALQRLEEMGYPVYIAEPLSLRSIASHLFRLGALTGHHETANELGADFLNQVQALQSGFAERETISVFYQVWHSPLISVGGQELINDMINICGGQNIFAELPIGPKVNLEDVLARDPQIILASGSDENMPLWLDDWRRWPELSSVQHNHLYSIPPDLVQRHSLRALQGLQQMCRYIDRARQ
ncbi:cobalamin-binding protein [Pseudohongiella spirulinae]|uniref:Putative vitamin B12 transport protein n=1 Tax=Pseudohongiella spirulinae TaxID=1249552 RepID=A0A0S2KBV3_9GAMM|nr:cobalamin-binding protein [Pseudohongiella spirulinae]ALO45410.1 Putative vitamin B12 transport protein [Pseudohongiella spirulinae]